MNGFVGRYNTTLDEKGRFALPAKLRSILGAGGKPQLDGALILTKGLEGCLSLYTEPEWNDIEKRLSSLSFTQRDFRYFGRRFFSMAAWVTPDRSGRILVPTHLIAEADLKKELLLIGVNKWIEVWNPERYEDYLRGYEATYEDVAERLFPRPSGDDRT
ncbi:MAG TPA: division/cell wall cluster transcriptional repressor MraZ [candidate division Zixibacteria bacterium]|nr:division/cell wall cluster transcriptional repressor MraZ [candidate division Zixibacteria bacterium]MDD4917975.1 division/cell wall cluster transcriptional repressor MraZ [candidate division Zixibacteria bacterium]MDM7972473.1 division/cell wall cluster transcriptional repressor MraZ [candidate division Zixibacteria bacterium]HOD66714.1 division/cell wall cluster transcriptional repressor MraZ [candidate division Zixibacteria bacterium]HOZ06983.1 division/cell wall cluster transcriptional r